MRLKGYFGAIWLLSFGNVAEARDTPTTQFLPTSPWAMDYAPEGCRLVRDFSDGKRQVTVAFERFSPGPKLRIGIAGDGVKLSFRPEQAKFRFGPVGKEQESPIYTTSLADGRRAYLLDPAALSEVPASKDALSYEQTLAEMYQAEDKAAAQIYSLVITHAFAPVPEFKLGSMVEPIKAMRACVDDLIKGWGIEARALGAPGAWPKPKNSPGTWLTPSDYPPEMVRQGRNGVVHVQIVVGEHGEVVGCHADTEMLGPFEDAVCDAISKRAQFEPGRDSTGKPMRSLSSTAVHFKLGS